MQRMEYLPTLDVLDDESSKSDGLAIVEEPQESKKSSSEHKYVNQKPKWWKKVAGRRGTKGQRACIQRMKHFIIPRLDKYEHHLDLTKLYESHEDGHEPPANGLLVPNSFNHSKTDNTDEKDRFPVVLELGFGLGDNLLSNAMMFPDSKFLGAEIHQPGVATVLYRMEQSIKECKYWAGQKWCKDNDESLTSLINNEEKTMSHPYDNVRVYPGDGVKLLKFIQDDSLDRVLLTFPDPWPQNNELQWRIIQRETVQLLGKKMRSGGLFYLATDVHSFSDWTRSIFTHVSSDDFSWEEVIPCPDRTQWLPVISKYEEKGLNEGRETLLQCWRRNTRSS